LTYDGFGMCEVDVGQVFQDVNGNGGTSSELNPGHVEAPGPGSVNALHGTRQRLVEDALERSSSLKRTHIFGRAKLNLQTLVVILQTILNIIEVPNVNTISRGTCV
jgi:hypothetical protein